MKDFTVLNARNGGCPVCQGTDGDCREKQLDNGSLLYLCHTNHNEVPGFVFISETSDGVWGEYFVDNREQWKAENKGNWNNSRGKGFNYSKAKVEADVKAKKEANAEGKSSASDRNEFYLDIFSQLSLADKDKDDLVRRGLSDQDIKDGHFVSVTQLTRLDKKYHNLPGLNGDKFITAGDGYLVPVRDIDGLFVGFQIRLHVSEGKYRWANDCHTLEHGELPLQVCLNNPNDKWIYLPEGILKPFVASKRLGVNTVGASGGQFASCSDTLTDIVNKTKGSQFCFTPDAGSKANSSILIQYRRTNKLLAKLGQTLWVLDYGQGFDKNMPDFDELEVIPANARYIKYSEWDMLAFIDLPDEDDIDDETPDNWKTKSAIKAHSQYQHKKAFTPDIIIDADKCPIGKFEHHKDKSRAIGFPNRGEILAIRLHTGQGKTTRIIRECSTKYSDAGALLLNHRNSLGDQFAKDNDVFIDKNGGEANDRFYMLNHINDIRYPRLVLCADSLVKFIGDLSIFDDKIIILDEFESLLRHITGGGTIKSRQKEIMGLIEEVFKRAYCVIISDANLADRSCEFVKNLTGFKLTKVSNKRLPKRPRVLLYDEVKGNPKYLIGRAYKEAFPWIMTDSAKASKAICRDALHLKEAKKYLEINADTINDNESDEAKDRLKWIRAFLEDPSIVDSEDFPYDGIVSSPTIESGLSSTSKRFTGVYMFITHLESLVSSQMIMRVRNIDCPRHISIKDYLNLPSNELRSPFEDTLAKNHTEYLQMAMNLYLEGSVDADQYKDILNQIIQGQVNNEWTKLVYYHKSITNYEQQNLKACALERLQEHGFEIEVITEEAQTEEEILSNKSLTYPKAKKEVKIEECEKIFKAGEITPERYEILSKCTDLTPKEKASMERYKITTTLPGIEKDKMWSVGFIYYLKESNPRVLKQAELRVLLSIDKLAKIRSEKVWDKIVGGNKFLGSFKDNHLLVKRLKEKGVMDLLVGLSEDLENCYSNDTPALITFYKEWGTKDAIATGIPKGASPVGLVKKLASRLGFTPKDEGRDHTGQRCFTLKDDFVGKREAKIMVIIETSLRLELGEKSPENQVENELLQKDVENGCNPYQEPEVVFTFDSGRVYTPVEIKCKENISLFGINPKVKIGVKTEVKAGQKTFKEIVRNGRGETSIKKFSTKEILASVERELTEDIGRAKDRIFNLLTSKQFNQMDTLMVRIAGGMNDLKHQIIKEIEVLDASSIYFFKLRAVENIQRYEAKVVAQINTKLS